MLHWQEVDRPLLERANRLGVISRHGVGIDNLDLEAATELGIDVVVAAKANFHSVAEQALALLFAVRRHVARGDRLVRTGGFGDRDPSYLGGQLHGTTMGIIGFGRIGAHLNTVSQALGMKVITHDPHVDPEEITEHGAHPAATLDELLESADQVTVNIPLTPDSRGLLGPRQFALMKRGSVLINTSRGGIVQESALADALRSGHLAGAALDVYEIEAPDDTNPLFTLDQVVLSPHVGAYTEAAERQMGLYAAQGIVDLWAGVDPDSRRRNWARAAGQPTPTKRRLVATGDGKASQ